MPMAQHNGPQCMGNSAPDTATRTEGQGLSPPRKQERRREVQPGGGALKKMDNMLQTPHPRARGCGGFGGLKGALLCTGPHIICPAPLAGEGLVQGAKMRKHGVAVFGQARVAAQHVPRSTCCRHKPTLPLHDNKRVSNRPAYTPEHKSTLKDSHTNTFTPRLTRPAACTKLQTTFAIGLQSRKRWFKKKAQKCENMRSPCLRKPVLGHRGGGYPHQLSRYPGGCAFL